MMQGRPSPRIKPQTTESRSSMGVHAPNISRSKSIIHGHGDGDFRNSSTTSVANKDQFSLQLQGTNKKNDGNGLTRSNSIRHDEERNIEIKKPVEHHYMKTTHSFNAKSKRPVDLDSPKVRKKVDPDPYATIARRRSDDIRGFQRNMLAEFDNANYSASRSRSSSVNSQYTPMLKRSPPVNSSRVPRQLNREGTEKPANNNKKKSVNREATVVESITTDHLGYTENVESDVKEIIEDMSSYLQYSNNQELSMLEIDEPQTQIKDEIISQTSNKLDEMEVLEEPGDLDLSFDHEVAEHNNSEETSKNFPEVETVETETVMEVSPKYPDSNVEVINENTILEECEATDETSASESELVPFPPEDISRERDEKHEVIDTKYEEISDLCVVSSCNDETERDEVCEISIEDEVSKMIVRENIEFECTEEEKRNLSSDIMSIIEEIAKEVEASCRGNGGNGGGTWMPTTWKVDYVLQRLIHKLELESTDSNNQVSKLIQAYESVIQLMMRRVNVTCSQLQLQRN